MSLGAAFRRLLPDPGSLGARAASASLWSAAGLGIRYPLRLASNLVMTRLLVPEAFGLMATVLVLHTALALLSDVGLIQSVIRDPRGASPRFLRVAWTVQCLRGVVIALAFAALGLVIHMAGPRLAAAGTVYADPRLPLLVWASMPLALAQGTASTALLLARRQMRMAPVIGLEILGQIVTIATMIALALAGLGVWALLLGQTVGALAESVLSHLILPGPRMRLAWDRAQAAEMWRFGRWIIGSSLATFVLNNADRLVFGLVFDVATLGIYSIAVIWTELGREIFARIAEAAVFPTLAEVRRTDPAALRRTLLRLLGLLLVGAVAVYGGLVAFGLVGFDLLYTDTYALAGGFILLRAVAVTFLPLAAVQQFLIAEGESRFAALAGLAAAAATLAALILLADAAAPGRAILVYALSAALVPAICLAHRRVRRLGIPRIVLPWLAGLLVWGAASYLILR